MHSASYGAEAHWRAATGNKATHAPVQPARAKKQGPTSLMALYLQQGQGGPAQPQGRDSKQPNLNAAMLVTAQAPAQQQRQPKPSRGPVAAAAGEATAGAAAEAQQRQPAGRRRELEGTTPGAAQQRPSAARAAPGGTSQRTPTQGCSPSRLHHARDEDEAEQQRHPKRRKKDTEASSGAQQSSRSERGTEGQSDEAPVLKRGRAAADGVQAEADKRQAVDPNTAAAGAADRRHDEERQQLLQQGGGSAVAELPARRLLRSSRAPVIKPAAAQEGDDWEQALGPLLAAATAMEAEAQQPLEQDQQQQPQSQTRSHDSAPTGGLATATSVTREVTGTREVTTAAEEPPGLSIPDASSQPTQPSVPLPLRRRPRKHAPESRDPDRQRGGPPPSQRQQDEERARQQWERERSLDSSQQSDEQLEAAAVLAGAHSQDEVGQEHSDVPAPVRRSSRSSKGRSKEGDFFWGGDAVLACGNQADKIGKQRQILAATAAATAQQKGAGAPGLQQLQQEPTASGPGASQQTWPQAAGTSQQWRHAAPRPPAPPAWLRHGAGVGVSAPTSTRPSCDSAGGGDSLSSRGAGGSGGIGGGCSSAASDLTEDEIDAMSALPYLKIAAPPAGDSGPHPPVTHLRAGPPQAPAQEPIFIVQPLPEGMRIQEPAPAPLAPAALKQDEQQASHMQPQQEPLRPRQQLKQEPLHLLPQQREFKVSNASAAPARPLQASTAVAGPPGQLPGLTSAGAAARQAACGDDGGDSPSANLLMCQEAAEEVLARGNSPQGGAAPPAAAPTNAAGGARIIFGAAVQHGEGGAAGGFIKLLPSGSRSSGQQAAAAAPAAQTGRQRVGGRGSRAPLQVVFRCGPAGAERQRLADPTGTPVAVPLPATARRQMPPLHLLAQPPQQQRFKSSQQQQRHQLQQQSHAQRPLLQPSAAGHGPHGAPHPNGAAAATGAGAGSASSADSGGRGSTPEEDGQAGGSASDGGSRDGLDAQQLRLIEKLLGPSGRAHGSGKSRQRRQQRQPVSKRAGEDVAHATPTWQQREQRQQEHAGRAGAAGAPRQQHAAAWRGEQRRPSAAQQPLQAPHAGAGGMQAGAGGVQTGWAQGAAAGAAASVSAGQQQQGRAAWQQPAEEELSGSPGTRAAKEAEAAALAAAESALARRDTAPSAALDQQQRRSGGGTGASTGGGGAEIGRREGACVSGAVS